MSYIRKVVSVKSLILLSIIIIMMLAPEETESLVPFAKSKTLNNIQNAIPNHNTKLKQKKDFSLDITDSEEEDPHFCKHPVSSILFCSGGSLTSKKERKNLIMSIALFATYFSVMGAKCALPSTFHLITSEASGLNFTKDPQSMMSRVLMISTASIALGKLVLGPVIDKFGGVVCLKVALITLSACLGTIAQTRSFRIFAISWVLVDFVFSSCWAACLSSIHSTFDEQDWTGKIGLLAVAGRIGNASSFFAFASILQWTQNQAIQMGQSIAASSWRLVFWLSSSLQLIPLLALMLFSHVNEDDTSRSMINDENALDIERRSASTQLSIQDSIRILMKEAHFPAFWMHMIARSSLMIIASFLLFVPSYMSTGFGMSSANASRVAALYAIGSMIAVTFGAKRFSSLNVNRQCAAVLMMFGSLLGVCILQIMHIHGMISVSPIIGGISMLVWGLAFSIPFYIPSSIYALRVGGRKSAATIADAFDFVGFSALAWFNSFVASRHQDVLSSWLNPFVVLSVFATTGLFSLVLALKFDRNSV